MEKLFLCLDFPTQKLNIVNEENIDISITSLEICGFVVTDAVNEFVGKFLGTYVANMCAFKQSPGVMPNGMEKVSFTKA